MTEVVLDVKLASLGVLNISPSGLADSKKKPNQTAVQLGG